MACMFLYPEKRSLTNDIMSDNPNKKIRLSLQKKNGGSAGNEDLWGQDDLTAEEFDMLEIQATQSCNQSVICQNNEAHDKVNYGGPQNAGQVDDLKQLQYELEGRVKLLSQSLERSLKELSEERLNKEKIIKDRMQEFFQREGNLQKELDKMQSILEFKEQEMKSVYSKVEILKSQLQDKKNGNTETFVPKNFDDFLKSSKSEVSHSSTSFTNKFHRRHKLLVDTPKGEAENIDILSSMLCSRLAVPILSVSDNFLSTNIGDTFSNFQLTPLSVVQLKTEQNCSELLEYYKYFLNSHVVHLRTNSSKSSAISSTKTSPILVKRKEAGSSSSVISCLKDIVHLLSCQRLDLDSKKCDNIQSSTTCNRLREINGQSTSSAEPVPMEVNVNDPVDSHLTLILGSLLALADPSTFPNGYPKMEEIELSLSTLLTICLSYPEMFLDRVSALPIHALSSPDCSVISMCTTLKLITTLSVYRNFILHLTHKNSNCLLCSLASFLCNTVCHSLEKFSVSMILVEDFLSTVLSVHNFSEIQIEASPCISEIIQGVIASLWNYYQQRDQITCSSIIINKGFFLLLLMSNHIPNFKEKRSPIEDKYIFLISSLLTLSKENTEFRELYDLIHILWDFQTDISEFDLDEPSDETQTSSNEVDNAE